MKPLSNIVGNQTDDSILFGVPRLKTRVIEQISHEFRTPLTSIIGFAEILKDELPINEHQRMEYAHYIQSEGLRLTKLIDDLIELDALEDGLADLDPQETDVHHLIAHAISLVSETAYNKFVTLSSDVPAEFLVVKLDCEKVVHILFQLLHNAVRYTPSGGCVQITCKAAEREIFFSVHDNGPGIHGRDIPLLFKRFGKLYRKEEGGHGGGIGLAIVKHLIDQLHGDITVQSRIGEGSTFTVRLPLVH